MIARLPFAGSIFFIQEWFVLIRIKHFFIVMTAIFFIIINCNSVFSSEDETVFDANFYLSIYPDLINAGYTEDNVKNHWINSGIYEGRQGSSIFDVKFYLQKYSDLQRAFGSNYHTATMHWINYGIYEGRQGSSTFDVHFYLQKYSDLQRAFGSDYYAATIHWINYGIYEGRQCVGHYPTDAGITEEIIRFEVPPNRYEAVTAHVIGVTIEQGVTPLIAAIYMDYLRLVEKTQTGQRRIIASREYNETHSSLVPYGGGLYDRFPEWFKTDNKTPIGNSGLKSSQNQRLKTGHPEGRAYLSDIGMKSKSAGLLLGLDR